MTGGRERLRQEDDLVERVLTNALICILFSMVFDRSMELYGQDTEKLLARQFYATFVIYLKNVHSLGPKRRGQ